MTGMAPVHLPVQSPAGGGTPVLEVQELSRPDSFRAVSLRLERGEVLGITGLLGSGRTELALALFGLKPAGSGRILRDGQPVRIRSVRDAMGQGIAYVPENRLAQGLVLHQSVARNLLLTVVRRTLTKLGLTDPRSQDAQVSRWIDQFRIKAPSPHARIETLSGGNQQRVVLAKWIATNPKVLILDNPTVGIDIAAKSGIHSTIRDLAAAGMGIIIISDEVGELVHTCNRVAVMAKGRIRQVFTGPGISVDAIAGAVAGRPGEAAG
jgi:simple sugar transport system ATP-binding protein